MPNPPRLSAALAETIRGKMAELQMSENALADAAAISPPTLRRRLRKPGDFTADELDAIATALGLDLLAFVVAAGEVAA